MFFCPEDTGELFDPGEESTYNDILFYLLWWTLGNYTDGLEKK